MRQIQKSMLTFLLTFMWLLGAYSQEKVVKILAIGNSFSQDAVEQYLHELAEAEGKSVVIGNMFIGGCSLERHVNNARNNAPAYAYRKIGLDGKKHEQKKVSLENALKDEEWDYVSLQQASPFSGLYNTYEASLPELMEYVKARLPKKCQLMLHQTWAYAASSNNSGFKNYNRDQLTMYHAITDAVRKAAKKNRIKIIIPSGTAIQNARTSFIGDHLDRDGYHLDVKVGRYTAACAWFERIFHSSVLDNTFKPEGLDEKRASIARQAAHAAVKHPFVITDLSSAEGADVMLYKEATAPVEQRVEDLLSRMTLEEKVMQLNQYTLGRNNNVNNVGEVVKTIPAEIGSLIYFETTPELRNNMQRRAMEESRLGIPILFGYDAIHGFRTIYPISLAQACSWNPTLVEEACAVSAQEARMSGVDWTFSPMIDVARDPRWGRVAEGYGEDPYTNGIFGAASVRGYQGNDLSAEDRVAACLKHYVGYGASEAGRDYVYTEISKQTLWDTYLLPYRMGVEAGAATLMSSFNDISGIPGSANFYTLTEILKNRWKHDGFVVSDWGAIEQLKNQGLTATKKEAARYAFSAGLEMDMMSHAYDRHLQELVKEGKISMNQVDEAVRRVLRLKFRLGLFEHPYTPITREGDRFLRPKSKQTAARLAAESMVLLKNENHTLPLIQSKKIAVIGPMAKNGWDLLGSWCGHGKDTDVEMLYDGLVAEFSGKAELRYAKGCATHGDNREGFAEALELARWSDVVVLCLGEMMTWSGENASRSSIALPQIQEELAKELKRAGKPMVLVLVNGRPLELNRLEPLSDAILEIWQPGILGATPMAGILSGRINPSGRLAITFPYSTGQIPIYYNRRKSGRGHQGFYKDITSEPLYPFGHGLSYTEFTYSSIRLSANQIRRGDKLTAEVSVTNVGKRDGEETVHWFVSDPYCSITRPVKELKYFEKQLIPVGETRTFRFEIDTVRDFSFVNDDGQYFLESGDFQIQVKGQTATIELVD